MNLVRFPSSSLLRSDWDDLCMCVMLLVDRRLFCVYCRYMYVCIYIHIIHMSAQYCKPSSSFRWRVSWPAYRIYIYIYIYIHTYRHTEVNTRHIHTRHTQIHTQTHTHTRARTHTEAYVFKSRNAFLTSSIILASSWWAALLDLAFMSVAKEDHTSWMTLLSSSDVALIPVSLLPCTCTCQWLTGYARDIHIAIFHLHNICYVWNHT